MVSTPRFRVVDINRSWRRKRVRSAAGRKRERASARRCVANLEAMQKLGESTYKRSNTDDSVSSLASDVSAEGAVFGLIGLSRGASVMDAQQRAAKQHIAASSGPHSPPSGAAGGVAAPPGSRPQQTANLPAMSQDASGSLSDAMQTEQGRGATPGGGLREVSRTGVSMAETLQWLRPRLDDARNEELKAAQEEYRKSAPKDSQAAGHELQRRICQVAGRDLLREFHSQMCGRNSPNLQASPQLPAQQPPPQQQQYLTSPLMPQAQLAGHLASQPLQAPSTAAHLAAQAPGIQGAQWGRALSYDAALRQRQQQQQQQQQSMAQRQLPSHLGPQLPSMATLQQVASFNKASRHNPMFLTPQSQPLSQPGPQGSQQQGFNYNAAPHAIRISIYEEADCYVTLIDLPGIQKSDVNLKAENEVVTITVASQSSQEKGTPVLDERPNLGGTWRQFTLPRQADLQRLAAKFSDGVLRLVAPKRTAELRDVAIE